MTRSTLPVPALALLAAACGANDRVEPVPPPAARLVSERPATPVADAVPQLFAAPVLPLAPAAPAAPAPRGAEPPLARVAAANREAVREPAGEAWTGAAYVYPWSDGALYRLYTAPERVSEIALEPGEALVSVAAGDTLRWVIGDTASGSGAARRTHVLVKPTAPGLSTNLVIATDRRVYHVALESTAGPAMASITWSYPAGALKVLDRAADPAPPADPGGIELERLGFGYAIEGDDPPWRPLRAFDDGAQVFIEFPAGLARGEAPPLFVTDEDGAAELVNYRVRGRWYVVDRLFAAAELRLGERRQQVVRIVRQGRGSGR